MQTLRKHFRKLIIAAVLALAVSASSIGSYASTLTIIATSSDGSIELVSCGSSAGDYRMVWFAPTNTYTYFDAEPGDCPPLDH
jgi:hypothetical protein